MQTKHSTKNSLHANSCGHIITQSSNRDSVIYCRCRRGPKIGDLFSGRSVTNHGNQRGMFLFWPPKSWWEGTDKRQQTLNEWQVEIRSNQPPPNATTNPSIALPRQSIHPNSRVTNMQNAFQQSCVNLRCQIVGSGHQQLPWMLSIEGPEYVRIPTK